MFRSRQWRPDETQTTVSYICLLEDNSDPMKTQIKFSFNENIITTHTLGLADYMSMKGQETEMYTLDKKNYHSKKK